MPAIDVENAWGLKATAYGNHEFDYGVTRLQAHQARANFPFLGANIVDANTGKYIGHFGAYGNNPVDDAAARAAGRRPPYARSISILVAS